MLISPHPPPPHAPPGPSVGGPSMGWGVCDINIHIDTNMNVDIHIIISMNIEYHISYYLFPIIYYPVGIKQGTI